MRSGCGSKQRSRRRHCPRRRHPSGLELCRSSRLHHPRPVASLGMARIKLVFPQTLLSRGTEEKLTPKTKSKCQQQKKVYCSVVFPHITFFFFVECNYLAWKFLRHTAFRLFFFFFEQQTVRMESPSFNAPISCFLNAENRKEKKSTALMQVLMLPTARVQTLTRHMPTRHSTAAEQF